VWEREWSLIGPDYVLAQGEKVKAKTRGGDEILCEVVSHVAEKWTNRESRYVIARFKIV
jgi:hypothetical protein